MENLIEKTKILRKRILQVFSMAVITQTIMAIMIPYILTSESDKIDYGLYIEGHLFLFSVYFLMSATLYFCPDAIVKWKSGGGEIAEPTVVPEPKEEPKIEVKRKAIKEIIMINNKTDKEYSVKSDNDFGLVWKYVGEKGEKYGVFTVNQKTTIHDEVWMARGRFSDFSIREIIWGEFFTKEYLDDLDKRCKEANFAPFDTKVPNPNEEFEWNEDTVKIAEEWLSGGDSKDKQVGVIKRVVLWKHESNGQTYVDCKDVSPEQLDECYKLYKSSGAERVNFSIMDNGEIISELVK